MKPLTFFNVEFRVLPDGTWTHYERRHALTAARGVVERMKRKNRRRQLLHKYDFRIIKETVTREAL
jgi:hypothetical protein